MLRGAVLLVATALSVAVVAAENPLTYEGSLSDGVDAAITKGWLQVASSLTIDNLSTVSVDRAGQALSSVNINGSQIVVSFDEAKLRDQLTAGGHASWSGLKDPVLIWLADVQNGHIVGGGTDHEFAQALTTQARADSYELMFPLMDLDDVQAVTVNDVLMHKDEVVTKASLRYAPKFFIAGAVEHNSEQVSFKWNVYDEAGRNLGHGEQLGTQEEVVDSGAKDIAKTLMANVSADSSESASAENTVSVTATDPLQLGPGSGFVRILITGVNNIQDVQNIKNSLITFGYEAASGVSAWRPEGAVFEVPTGASPAILDGTLAHASGFSKTGDWTYAYHSTLNIASSGRDGNVGAPSYASVTLRNAKPKSAVVTPVNTNVKVEKAVETTQFVSALVED